MSRCYYCGSPATTSEHVPPRQMFKGIPGHRITVPSCPKHNGAKSDQDRIILRFMLMYVERQSLARELHPHVLLAIAQAKPYFREVERHTGLSAVLAEPVAGLDEPQLHLSPSAHVSAWMHQLTAALVYSATKEFDPAIKWDSASVFSPQWIPSAEAKPIENQQVLAWALAVRDLNSHLERVDWHRGWWSSGSKSYPMAIYRFALHFDSEVVILRHTFFNELNWFVAFDSSSRTRLKLKAATEGRLEHS